MNEQPQRTVNWLAVIGGLLLAWFIGIAASIGSLAAGAMLLPTKEALAVVLAVIAILLFYFAVFLFARKHVRDFALGFVIGGCTVAIATGLCGALLVGMTVH